MSSEYQVRLRQKPNPVANDPALRIRLTSKYDAEAGASKELPSPYRDSDGNYVFKTPIDNVKMANTALDEVKPAVANDPAVIKAKLFC
jgi:hypothetical protein